MANASFSDDRPRDVRPFDFRSIVRPVVNEQPSVPSHFDYLLSALQRLEETVDQETVALQSLDASSVGDFNSRKSQSLLELSRAQRLVRGQDLAPEVKTRLQALHTKLENNRWLLLLHLEAVREVASIISMAIQETESDGTYTRDSQPHPNRG